MKDTKFPNISKVVGFCITFVLLSGLAFAQRFEDVIKPQVEIRKENEPDSHNQTQPKNPYLWEPKVESVAVFKNGLGFVMRRGKVALREGWCLTEQIPPAAFGTLAVYSINEKHIVDIVGSGPGQIVEFDGRDAPKSLSYKRERISAAENLKVQLTYDYQGKERTAAGKLVTVGTEFVILEAENNNFAVPLKGVTKMQILELPLRVHVQDENKQAPEKTELGIAYLRKGMTWIPEYTVRILDDDNARITLRGTLVNEAEDLIDCNVNFVVGVPHFLHTDYMAPIAVGQVIRTIGSAIAPSQISRQIRNRAAITSNTAYSDQFRGYNIVEEPVGRRGGDVTKLLGNLPRMESAAATDYTVYTKENLTLRRGEKAIVTLFVKTIKYSHLYRWLPPEKIKHFLVLHNTTDSAWTTGPYLAVSEEKPLSEDLLRYTPVGGNCELPVTEAVNIAHEKSESEIDRDLKAHSPRKDRYLDLVTLEGTLKLRNFEKEPASIVVNVSVPGMPLSASDKGKLQSDPTKLRLTERSGDIRWSLTLKPGETKILTYKYQRYVTSG